MFSFTSQTYSNNPAPMGLQTWAASLNMERDLLKECWSIWPWRNAKKWKSNEMHRTFLSPRLCLAWIQWTRLISTGSPITDCYLPRLWSRATARAEEQKYLWESLIPLVRNQKSKEPLETLTECKKLITFFREGQKTLFVIVDCNMCHGRKFLDSIPSS